jgi:hypothetical protein
MPIAARKSATPAKPLASNIGVRRSISDVVSRSSIVRTP